MSQLLIVVSIGLMTGIKNITNIPIASKPNFSMASIMRCSGAGANAYNTLEPSKGGKGIILKMKKPTLIAMNSSKNN